MPNKKKFDLI